MATIGNAQSFRVEGNVPGNLTVSGNATISGSSATVNGDEVRTLGTSGAILQVVSVNTDTKVTVSTGTFTDTGLSASITPTSSSNKILVLVNQQFNVRRSVDSNGHGLQLLRGSTTIWESAKNSTGGLMNYMNGVGGRSFWGYATIQYLDSPATTSSTTYKTQGRPYLTTSSGLVDYQRDQTDANGRSTITLMEIVG